MEQKMQVRFWSPKGYQVEMFGRSFLGGFFGFFSSIHPGG
jgi:hypothetical protein